MTQISREELLKKARDLAYKEDYKSLSGCYSEYKEVNDYIDMALSRVVPEYISRKNYPVHVERYFEFMEQYANCPIRDTWLKALYLCPPNTAGELFFKGLFTFFDVTMEYVYLEYHGNELHFYLRSERDLFDGMYHRSDNIKFYINSDGSLCPVKPSHMLSPTFYQLRESIEGFNESTGLDFKLAQFRLS